MLVERADRCVDIRSSGVLLRERVDARSDVWVADRHTVRGLDDDLPAGAGELGEAGRERVEGLLGLGAGDLEDVDDTALQGGGGRAGEEEPCLLYTSRCV